MIPWTLIITGPTAARTRGNYLNETWITHALPGTTSLLMRLLCGRALLTCGLISAARAPDAPTCPLQTDEWDPGARAEAARPGGAQSRRSQTGTPPNNGTGNARGVIMYHEWTSRLFESIPKESIRKRVDSNSYKCKQQRMTKLQRWLMSAYINKVTRMYAHSQILVQTPNRPPHYRISTRRQSFDVSFTNESVHYAESVYNKFTKSFMLLIKSSLATNDDFSVTIQHAR